MIAPDRLHSRDVNVTDTLQHHENGMAFTHEHTYTHIHTHKTSVPEVDQPLGAKQKGKKTGKKPQATTKKRARERESGRARGRESGW